MNKPYRHYAWNLSYFSGKTRAYLRYKGIPHVETPHNLYTLMVKTKNKTGAAVMPVVVTPEGEWLQDSSYIIDRLEQRYPQSPVIPATPKQKMAAYLIELWSDEWWLVIGLYTRWCHPENYPLFQHDAGTQLLPGFPRFLQNKMGATIANQLRAYLPALGITPASQPGIDRWTRDTLDLLEQHFSIHPFLFGDKPSLGDFGLVGPLYAHLARDPWSKRELIEPRPHVRAWVERMQNPSQPLSGAFLPQDQIPKTLTPILSMIFREMLPWITGTLRQVEQVLPTLHPGQLLPRGLKSVEFPMGDGRHRRSALPYVLWMVQRIQDAFEQMEAADQKAARNWLLSLDGEEILDMKIPRLQRHGLRVGPHAQNV